MNNFLKDILYNFMVKSTDSMNLSLSLVNFLLMMKFVLHAQGFTFKKSYLSIGPPSWGWILVPSKGWKFTVQIKKEEKKSDERFFSFNLRIKRTFVAWQGLEKLSG